MASDMDFNGADTQDAAFDLIPANTLAKVCLTIRPGGAGPEGWLTQSKTSPALYLNTEAVVMEGPFARRRIYTRIGFRGKAAGGPGDDTYGNRGRAMIRGILESARGVRADDQSNAARAARMASAASLRCCFCSSMSVFNSRLASRIRSIFSLRASSFGF